MGRGERKLIGQPEEGKEEERKGEDRPNPGDPRAPNPPTQRNSDGSKPFFRRFSSHLHLQASPHLFSFILLSRLDRNWAKSATFGDGDSGGSCVDSPNSETISSNWHYTYTSLEA
ncbi:hypothetical protein C1H46_003251 [Malus baccata]|uniref:Uncharacterized protein n=1 Tax=Malus baccata TaxID=106549 RepID=A0A540NJQ4_MALBA|nr:hypothetical protein C1H46_003251 [Malus baccata]